MLKVVIDTNVFISGVLVEAGNPSLVIKAWKRARKYQLFITEEIIQESLKVMRRLNVDPGIIADWDKVIRKNAISVVPARKIKVIKEDPSDNKFLECAIEAQADYIISGDKHLKKLVEFEGIKIIDVRKFLDILAERRV
ncbi:MAG: putative toxin-antitoxin system toxin component, PIN family [Candidatus Omnitrophota bacterium]|nr:putative toxin-antitoxin system toxin component, PIN family [Candidatus Omnitrophota bacterium]